MDSLIARIQGNLTPDLLKPEYRGHSHPHYGHCYVASEVWWHLEGRERGYVPQVIRHEGGTHWYLRRGDHVVDLTAAQFDAPVPYERGRACGFLTRHPSKRAQKLISRL